MILLLEILHHDYDLALFCLGLMLGKILFVILGWMCRSADAKHAGKAQGLANFFWFLGIIVFS